MERDKDLSLTVETTQGSWKQDFPRNDKVEQVIQAVVRHFGFAPDGNYELRLKASPNEALNPERPLVSYHIEDGAVLIFTDLGIAV
jgi:hypothetical protein